MILAAGRGDRMRPLTDTTPKAMLSVRGKPLIEYHIEALARAGIRDIVINLAWLGQQIRSYLGDGKRYGASIMYSDEGHSALETGGGILKALPLLGDEPFWVVNADVYTGFEFSVPRLADHVLAHLVMVPNPEHNAAGDFGLVDGSIVSESKPALTFSGLSVICPDLVRNAGTGAFPLAPLLTAAAGKNRVSGELFTGLWFDVGTIERLRRLEERQE